MDGGRSLAAADNAAEPIVGHRHGHRTRSLTGTFGPTRLAIPRARIVAKEGKTTEWNSKALRAYQRRTRAADALIASAYLSGTNTRRVRRALAALFGGAVGKDTVSRVWRKVKGDWDAWNVRSLAGEPIIRLILDGTVVRVRLDKKSTSISLLVVLGVRQDGQKVLLAVKNMGGERSQARRAKNSGDLKTPVRDQAPKPASKPRQRAPRRAQRLFQATQAIDFASLPRKQEKVSARAQCVADDAVDGEPVFRLEFPANREKNREFFDFRPFFRAIA